jgi:hypothetical protein
MEESLPQLFTSYGTKQARLHRYKLLDRKPKTTSKYIINKSYNVFYKRVRITSECAPHQLSATRKLPTIMAPSTQAQLALYEADIYLAISALQQNQFQSEGVAAKTFNVSRDILRR